MIWRATVATLALSAILTGYLAWLMFGEMNKLERLVGVSMSAFAVWPMAYAGSAVIGLILAYRVSGVPSRNVMTWAALWAGWTAASTFIQPTALGNVATLALIVTAAIAAALTWRLRDSVTA